MGFYRTVAKPLEGEIVRIGEETSVFLDGKWGPIPEYVASLVDRYIERSHQLPTFAIYWLEPVEGEYRCYSKLWQRVEPEEAFREELTIWLIKRVAEGCNFDFSIENVETENP